MDYDVRFKSLLTLFFREFLELFFPDFAERIDWRHAPEFLDKELQSIIVESGPKTVDLLAKVWSREAPSSTSHRHYKRDRVPSFYASSGDKTFASYTSVKRSSRPWTL